MAKQTSLFSDDMPVAQPSLQPSNALATSALKRGASQATPAQKRFNQLVTQTETLVRTIESTRLAMDTHRGLHASSLAPLEKERDAHMRQMALWLAER